eukprot:TRINITY_DN13525_c0_g1_i2.p1 TRINITY_DN13525_c0_g1~~TRINITY_DN13525_c0_g1_i2.p1  ORF type:complete len:448 (+),score=86.69 TRINITY_DN13525_c0_g1_i2:25-1344(+)
MFVSKLWNQILEGVTHTVLSARREGCRSGKRVAAAFEILHLDIEAIDEVDKAVEKVMAGSRSGLCIGVFSGGGTGPAILLELWSIERSEGTLQEHRVIKEREELTVARLLMRSIHTATRLLPLGLKRNKVDFFVCPINCLDTRTGVLHPGSAFTSNGVPFEGTVRFSSLQETRTFAPLNMPGSFNVQIKASYASVIPDMEPPTEPITYSIIGDYVNRGQDQAAIPPPFTKSNPSMGNTSFSSPMGVHGRSLPVQIPSSGGKGTGTVVSNTPPPPFALTPTPGSLQSTSSLSKIGTFKFGSTSVSPPDTPSILSQWTPRLEVTQNSGWVPKPEKDMTASIQQQDLSEYVAFLEEDELGEAEQALNPQEHVDDEVSKFRERMQGVTLSSGFGYVAASSQSSLRNHSFNTATLPPARTGRSLKHQFMQLQSEFAAYRGSCDA